MLKITNIAVCSVDPYNTNVYIKSYEKFDEIQPVDYTYPFFVSIHYTNVGQAALLTTLTSEEDYFEFRMALERSNAWNPKKKDENMEFIFDVYDRDGNRLETFTTLKSLLASHVADGNYVTITHGVSNKAIRILFNETDLNGLKDFLDKFKKDYSELAVNKIEFKKPDAINPAHYKCYLDLETDPLQWLETMQYLPRFKNNPDVFKGAVELQIRKYLDRNGRKDNELQELKKALWYLKFLIAYQANGDKPIRVKDIENLLK